MRKNRLAVTVKQVRACAFQHFKALYKILWSVMGFGFCLFFKKATDDYINPLLDLEVSLPPILILNLDEGSSAFAMTWFLSFYTHIRFTPMRDMFHREWNDIRLVLGAEKLWRVILLTTMLFNVPLRPWESHSFWFKITGAAYA